jgi:type II secretory pathway component PulJ
MPLNAKHHRRFRWILAALAFVCALDPAAADDSLSTSTADGYARLLFTLTPADRVTAQATGEILTITFNRQVAVSATTIAEALPGYIASARADADGKTFRFALNQPVRIHVSSSGAKFAVDLAPPNYAGTPPNLPPPPPPPAKIVDVSKLPPLAVRAGEYQNYTRIVFDWPRDVPYAVFPGAGKLTIRFEALARPDLSAITRQAPPWVKTAGWHVENQGTVVDLETDAASGFHDFRDGTHVVVDVLAPKTDADAYKAAAKPVTTISKQTAKVTGASAAQVNAIASAAAKLNAPPPKPADSKQVATGKPAVLAPAKSTAQPPAPATAPATVQAAALPASAPVPADTNVQTAATKLTHDGVVLSFPGAGRKGSAVFIRGLTAWIILQDAPPLDAAKLKTQLGTFPDAIDAASFGNVSELRISLKQPEQIAAMSEGSTLKVVIAPQANSPAITIGFSRNQDSPTHSSITTLLPGATKTVTIVDPVVGDELIVIPGTAGRDIPDERDYVEFSALQTASGMVLLPYVDDLSVTIDRTRVTITQPGGLSLTPPSMPMAATPEALAGGKDPCFLDFASWQKQTGGTFLATERRLRAAIARLKPADANHARLVFARFYLANGFAAEALGLIQSMQNADPSLQGDLQLQTMRASADYDMGRYRDAHNDIAGAQFDSDRHAALWRGLIDTALQNWNDAHEDFERAMPALNAYPPEMRARVRLANAEAALGMGRLEIVDAQLSRLPADLDARLTLEADLDRARLYAAENRKDRADPLFAAVESSGDEQFASQAIYYRVCAGLASGTMSTTSAINALERLRYRWRGDMLELNTLRKLASLYFAQKQWREGLQRLRIAAENFPNYDLAGKAQDDMRAAFVDLFLKGKANSMPPVQALSVFYDFIDLTPIGPDGDEMIRRMADRLVAVDLLGPAADLLQYQVTKRLDGVAAAQVATRLAMIRLMDHKPQAAIDALRSTQVASLPDDVAHQRLLLQARALAELKQWDQALDLISVDQAPDTVRLRADIYWQSGNWAVAGQKAEEALGTRWNDPAPLSADERQEAMRAAVAYSLANDEVSLDRLRTHFAAKMTGTPDADAFAVVTQRIDMHGLAFRDAAAQVASIDTLTTFMKDLARHPLASD